MTREKFKTTTFTEALSSFAPVLWVPLSLLWFSTCAEPDYLEPPPTTPSSTQSTSDAGGAAPDTAEAAAPAATVPATPVAAPPTPEPTPPPAPVDPKVACNTSGKFYDDISGGAIACTAMEALKPSDCSDSGGLSSYFTSKLSPASQADLTSKMGLFEVATHNFDQCLICPANSTELVCERQNPNVAQTAPMLKVFMSNKATPTEGFWVELLYEVVP